MRTVTILTLEDTERERRRRLVHACRELNVQSLAEAEALEGGIVKTVSNFKDIGERIVVYHMVRVVNGEVMDMRTAVTEAEVLHHRSAVARKLWHSRKVLRRAVLLAMPKLTEDAFYERFQPYKNHMNPHASFGGGLYETYGPELAYVQRANPACVWTVLDCDGDLVLANGFHYVNRIGYLICRVPVEGDATYEVAL